LDPAFWVGRELIDGGTQAGEARRGAESPNFVKKKKKKKGGGELMCEIPVISLLQSPSSLPCKTSPDNSRRRDRNKTFMPQSLDNIENMK
jgi:hypothetical protein